MTNEELRYLILDGSTLPDKESIGGKAWSIARMSQLGLPVPPAFALTTAVCRDYHETEEVPEDAWERSVEGISYLEEETGRTFGKGPRPLLVSVRSGAAVSMPGMMDTVLNLGMNNEVENALAEESGDARYARQTHRRFCIQYARIVLNTPLFLSEDDGSSPEELRERVRERSGKEIPTDPMAQLRGAIAAVFESWNTRRAVNYRNHWGIPDDLGTAVTVQAMIFGNLDERSGTGVLFTRNPLTGDKEPYGEYLPMGQGEDVVSGEFDPESLEDLMAELPEVHEELLAAGRALEQAVRDVQDIEFTIERGRLFLLQTRNAKRSPQAAVRIAVDLVDEGVLDPAEAVDHVTASQVRTLLRPRLADGIAETAEVLAAGESACPGVASGVVVVESDDAEELGEQGVDVVLARPTTSPEDVHAMITSVAVVTEQGGSTSHAAVVSRALGRPCVVGCGRDELAKLAGRQVTVDGGAGKVYDGVLPTERRSVDDDPYLQRLQAWARDLAPLDVFESGAEDIPEGVVDLDALGVDDSDEIGEHLDGARAAKGAILEQEDGLQKALEAGVGSVVVEHALPALLQSISQEGKLREEITPYV